MTNIKMIGGEETGRQHNPLSLFSLQKQTKIIFHYHHIRQLSGRKLSSVTIGSDLKPIKFKECLHYWATMSYTTSIIHYPGNQDQIEAIAALFSVPTAHAH